MQTVANILALDVGERRVGLAIASWAAGLARPLTTLQRDEHFWEEIGKIIKAETVEAVVIGLPRGMQGQETAQTHTIHEFTREFGENFDLPLHLQDEALTSHQAAAELASRGKHYDKAAIDALAATYILEDFLSHHEGYHA